MFARLLVLASLIAATLFPTSAFAERRVALVIGNSSYQNAAALRNPRNDSNEMADALKKLGFKVLLGQDLDQQKFARLIDQFGRMLDEADVGLFFYAGHGLQINERNYLVSTNAQLTSEFLIPAETIELDSVVRLMESKTAVNLVFLDACRNNPLAEDLRKNLAALNRSVTLGRGLARVETKGRDTLIAFAAAPGQEAADGNGTNSPFTTALLRRLPQPGVEVSVMLKQVASDVRELTQNNQRPQQLSDMGRLFYFAKAEEPAAASAAVAKAAPAPVVPPASAADDRNLDVAFWTAAQAADHCEAMQAYMRRFPNGVFVELARLSERRLCAAKPDVAKSDVVPSAAAEIAAANEPAKAPDTGREATKIASVSEPAPASLPPAVAAAAAPAPAATAAAELARNAQLELIRLGCSDIEANGDWGDASRKAVRLFNKKVKAKLNIEKPNDALLAALRKKSDRVCPLVCESGFRAKGNTCVAVRSEPSRNAKRTTRQHQERPVAEQRRRARPVYQEAAPRQQPQSQPNIGAAVPVGIMLMHGMGGLRFR